MAIITEIRRKDKDSNDMWVKGQAVTGDGRGTGLGFPTANLILEEENQRPKDGIYACWAKIGTDEKIWSAVLHVGPRPTFPGASTTVELHVLDFPPQPFYHQILSFECVKKIRDVAAFTTIQDLITAIQNDCIQAKIILTSQP